MYDEGAKGYLELNEAKKFFAIILDLNYNQLKDRETFRKILCIIDP
jgi:hypothetical protein